MKIQGGDGPPALAADAHVCNQFFLWLTSTERVLDEDSDSVGVFSDLAKRVLNFARNQTC